MTDYYKVYMQKEGDGTPLKETIAAFGMYCMSIPMSVGDGIKALSERSWAGEDVLYSCVPGRLSLEAYTIKIKFGYKGAKYGANPKLKEFVDYLTGADGSGVYMKLYCDYTGIGRRHVRLTKLPGEAELVRNGDEGDILVAEFEFKADDPVTSISTITNNKGIITRLG